jgi:GR25 family glycosyltransferase involved in LPS biosynthesis
MLASNRGRTHFMEAITSYQMALQLKPSYPEAHFNLSLDLLLTSGYLRGWEEYEWRFKKTTNPIKAAISTPMWNGQLLNNQNILLWSEQGLGDSIQFIRYALLLQQQDISITIATNRLLVRLFKECLPTANFEILDQNRADLSGHEVHTFLMSLPRMFQTTLENMPATVPYIQPSGTMPENLRLERDGSFQVGIVWASDPNNVELYQQKSIPLELFLGPFADLVRSRKVSLWSLQVGNDAKQLEKWLDLPGVNDLSPRLKDFVDTAWAIEQLDLVITVDTAVAHLAGAMGKPVWVLLPFVPDWRWLLDRQDSPWYPTMRLFRQPSPGDWQAVLTQVQAKLQDVLLGESVVFSPRDRLQPLPIEPTASRSETERLSTTMPRILVMSLRRRRDRYENFLRWNDQQAINYELFEAIDGQALHFPDLVRDHLAAPQLQHYSPGALGCALSHRSLWQLCVAEDRAIIICEDDAVLRKDFSIIVPRLLQQLPVDWDILLLGYNFDSAISVEISPGVMMNAGFSPPNLINQDLLAFQTSVSKSVVLPMHNAFGNCAYVISPKGALELLDRCFPLTNKTYYIPCLNRTITSFGTDSLTNEFFKEIKAFCVVPPVALSPNDKRNSDISKQ